jgi:hypothetical protein
LDPKIGEGVDPGRRPQVHTATMAAITAVRPAQRDELLTPETRATAAAVAGVHFHSGFVDEFHGLRRKPRRSRGWKGAE